MLAALAFMFLPLAGDAQMVLEGIRRTMYAGSWYESDPDKLKSQLAQFLSRATPAVDNGSAALLAPINPPVEHPLLAIVAPHAGYQFSGQAAAYAYKQAQGQEVKRIFLLGPSHHVGFHGAALPMQVTFQTPFGDLDVDRETIDELKGYALFAKLPEVHRVEHSLEMQLPFIRQVFGDVKIVPIVIGMLSDETEIRLMAEVLKGYVARGDLVIVSSDFTHYGPRYDYEPFKDDVRENIRKLDRQAFQFLSNHDLDRFLKFQEETKDTICGFYPCSVLSAMLPESAKGTLLKYYTSQDTGVEDNSNSVSYMAIAFSGGNWPEHPESSYKASETIHLTNSDREALLTIARKTLDLYVKQKKEPITVEELGVKVSPAMKQRLGVFVTLNKFPPGYKGKPAPGCGVNDGRELRGCIGYIWPLKPLYQAVIDNAVSAASRDYRFYSVQPDELKDIHIEISVLTPPRRVHSYQDFVLGRDGIVLFKDGHQSVFLPFVPTMFGWDLPETLTQLSKKAGLAADDWKEGCKWDVFQAEVFEEEHPPG
jgi:AmmeMemoRadiSam system protein B/AmmeMemoRadiSam system protein A